ncbi:alpha/beta family hydrolase [Carboxydochorda subterranea]|uniref:Alpha/beta family hydrolase n=1 Tax=Carboxydichorda subterranea TaxID=3109565 RepID=A0ABZ1C1L4_9FIRM|nr:alpha/beta family hydrolase [Limnochorda sp. L945t]WRP18908.1 alpha/beta family hydrolase [Limnochorda sp. L945t]
MVLPSLIDRSQWESGTSFQSFVEASPSASARRMRRYYEQAPDIPEAVRERARAFAASGGRLYALAEAWCPDCMATVPVLARLAEAGGVPLRLFRRDERPDLRERHLTAGRPKIPLAVAVREAPEGPWQEVGRFVERPARANALIAEASRAGRDAGRELLQAYADGSLRDAMVAELDAMIGGGIEEARVAGSRGTPLPVFLHLPYQVTPAAVVVAMHGASHDASHPLSFHLCQRLAQRGLAAVRFDFGYRVRGETTPTLHPEGEDLAAVLDWVGTRLGLPPERTVLAGKSLGARVSVMAASRRPFAGLVLFGFPLHMPDGSFPAAEDTFDRIETPMLWFSGTQDPLADPAQVERHAARVRAPLTLRWLEGADHSLASHLHEVLDEAAQWILDRCVPARFAA